MNAREVGTQAAAKAIYNRINEGRSDRLGTSAFDAILAALAEAHPGCLLDPASGKMVQLEKFGWTCIQHSGHDTYNPCDHGQPCGDTYRLVPVEPLCPDCGGEKVIRETIYGPVDVDVNDHPCPTCDKGDNNGK